MKKLLTAFFALLLSALSVVAQTHSVKSPDGQLVLSVNLKNGAPVYEVQYKGQVMLEESPLGIVSDVADFSQGLQWSDNKSDKIDKRYTLNRAKVANVRYQANELITTFSNGKGEKLDITFRVSNNDIAFRYTLPADKEKYSCQIKKELTGFNFPQQTTTFLTPQASPMIGWEETKPSYEEEYVPDEAMGTPSKYGVGYTFPGLFHIGADGWVLLSETGVGGNYCGSKLSEGTQDGLYHIAFPEPGENNGMGEVNPMVYLPGATPWRTITVGDNLKPIVETTIPFDVVEPLYEPSRDYSFGRGVWSWIIWQDESINYEDQKSYIDLAAAMGYEFSLVDNWWDTRIGRDKIEELAKYAASKNVGLCLWYNSNGHWNNAPQGPRNCMDNPIVRKQEMAWMQSIGVKGIKVDFFGGDKQCTMQLYEDILSDANDYGLVVIFHGCTLPRGWDRMYPNFVGSEAVLASENLVFTQHANDNEAYNACLHPFIRNTVASMDFGPVLLQKQHSRNPEEGKFRRTSETFQLATAVISRTHVQNFAITRYDLTNTTDFVIDFMKAVPTTWDETLFIDGYPGKYCVLARRHGATWYVAGINAEAKEKKIKLNLPMLAGQTVSLYSDKKELSPQLSEMKIKEKGEVTLTIQPNGGVIITNYELRITNCKAIDEVNYELGITNYKSGIEEKDLTAYLFTYFGGGGNGEAIRFAVSHDGYNYRALNNNEPIMDSKKVSSAGGLRDPHIMRAEDGKNFYMVATDMKAALGWDSNRAMVLMKSTDLINWATNIVNIQKKYPGNEELKRVWAPQTIYDRQAGKYLIYWSMKHGDEGRDIIYYAYANSEFTDLEGEPKQMFFPKDGKSCIDGDIIYQDGIYHLFYKTEGHGDGIRLATSRSLTSGVWDEKEGYKQQTRESVEGSGIFKLNNSDSYIMMYDVYRKKEFHFTKSDDLEIFKAIDNEISMDFKPRHGTIMPITNAELRRLLNHWGKPEGFADVNRNPIITGYYADPEILYSEKEKRYYLYPTSDGFQDWGGYYFKAFSSDNLVDWKDEGVILDLKKDVPWAGRNAWAPTIIEKKIKKNKYKYYYYFTGAQKIGVAVSDKPTGPFVDSGKPLIDWKPEGINRGQEIDPDVFHDPVSGKEYLYWGNGYLAVAELNKDMVSIKKETLKTFSVPYFREAVEVFYRKGIYYFLYSENDTRSEDYRVRYGMAKSPTGPIEYPEDNLILVKDPEKGIYGTGHNCVLQLPGTDEWQMIYHRFSRPNGIEMGRAAGYHREVCMDKMEFNEDGTIKRLTIDN